MTNLGMDQVSQLDERVTQNIIRRVQTQYALNRNQLQLIERLTCSVNSDDRVLRKKRKDIINSQCKYFCSETFEYNLNYIHDSDLDFFKLKNRRLYEGN